METQHLTVRIPIGLLKQIDKVVINSKRSKTDVVVEALQLGLARKEEEELAAGFALLGDPDMQDMVFPTGAQKETMTLAD